MFTVTTYPMSLILDDLPFIFLEREKIYHLIITKTYFSQQFDEHLPTIKKRLRNEKYSKIKTLTNKSFKITKEELKAISYFHPHLSDIILKKKRHRPKKTKNILLRKFDFDYTSISDLFIFPNFQTNKLTLLLISKDKNYDIKNVTTELLRLTQNLSFYKPSNGVFYSLKDEETKDEGLFSDDQGYSDVDGDTRQMIAEIQNIVSRASMNGKFFALLPFLEQQIADIKARQKLSPLFIDGESRIFLPAYNNMEVKMGHLTKAIYFLFLVHDEIHLNDLQNHKDTIISIYKNLSNRLDYDKLMNSVDHLVKNKNGEVYTHFSRIKSAFSQKISEALAKNYIILGDKGEPKKIMLDSKLHNLKIENHKLKLKEKS